MHFRNLLYASLFGLTSATPTEKRQVTAITGSLAQIQMAVDALDTSVKQFAGSGSVTDLQMKATAIQNAIQAGTQTVNAAQPITAQEALGVAGSSNSLTTSVTNTINDLVAQKSALDAAGVSGIVLQQLQAQQAASNSFAQAVTAKVPANLQGTASQVGGQIGGALNKGITAFGGSASTSSSPATQSGSPIAQTESAGSSVAINFKLLSLVASLSSGALLLFAC